MASNIAGAGWNVTAWNRSDTVFEDLSGVRRAASVAELRNENTIIFMLPDLPFIEEAATELLESWRNDPPDRAPPSSS